MGSVWRFLAAVSVAALSGSVLMAFWSASNAWLAEFSIFTPAESFRLVLAYALILSWPAVAVAMWVFIPLSNRVLPARGARRRNLALFIGALGGVVVAIPVAAVLLDGELWAAMPVGLIYGLSSAAAALLILPKPDLGGEIA
jgi:hypothetical protein